MLTPRLDLLLVNAPSRERVYQSLASEFAAVEPPVWAGLIAQRALSAGFTVKILDAEAEGLSITNTADRIRIIDPKLAVFCIYGQQPSASTQCLPAAEQTATEVNWDSYDRIPTLALGTHPSALPFRTMEEGPWTYVAQGEGVETVMALLYRNRDPEYGQDIAFIPGLWWRDDSENVKAPLVQSANVLRLDDELPEQAWSLLDMKRYRAHNWHLWTGDQEGGYASVQTSLGCPFRCQFCCINAPFSGSGIRYWSPANVAAQIARLVSVYQITNIKIPDEMFVLNRSHVWQICNHLIDMKLGDRLNIWAYARIDTVKDQQLLDRMRRAGFRWLGLGIESGSKYVRDGVEKGRFTDGDIAAAVQRVQAAGICVGANYIFGLPDDTMESMQATLDLACELNTEWANFYCAMAYPGSVLYAQAKERKWELPDSPTGPGWIGYAQHAYECFPLANEHLTREQILDFRDSAFLQYFSRGAYLSMLNQKFGTRAVKNVERMLSLGKPARKHRRA